MLIPESPTLARVLVVDDDNATRHLIGETLTARGHFVRDAATGTDALDQCRNAVFDVVILDLGLPDNDGMTVSDQLRTLSDASIIIVTGRNSEADRIRGLAGGADDYVIKPFSPVELALRVDAVLRRRTIPTADTEDLVLGDIRISPSTRTTSVAGREVSLTKTEYTLLLILARQAGEIVSRDDLAQRCWGTKLDADRRLVTVHLGNLRHKIDPEQRRLITVRGVGYRLATATPDAPDQPITGLAGSVGQPVT